MSEPRLFVDAALSEGVRIRLNEAQGRKLTQTLRLGLGAPVRVFNGGDGEWRAEIDAKDRNGVGLKLRAQTRAQQPSSDILLLFAPVKRQATDLIIEKATELGVSAIQPVITQRTIAETVRLDRLNLIAREAAEQCERLDAPSIAEPLSLQKTLAAWDPNRNLVYADEQGDDPCERWGGEAGRAPDILSALRDRKPKKVALLIGPEGGFTPDERRLLRAQDFVIPVSLGPRILRAETAVIAALSVMQACSGDWGNG